MKSKMAASQSNGKNQNEPRELDDWEKYCDEANWHEAANIVPLLSEDKLKALADDIHEHGLLNPIVLADGKVIDGRNRLLACKMADVTPTFVELKETNLSRVEWVISQNVIRRHLTPTQLAVVAYDALPLFEAEARERQKAHGGTAPGKSKSTPGKNSTSDGAEKYTARAQAAKAVGVNEHYVSDVKTINEKSPGFLPQMRSGELTITEAKKQVVGGGQEKKRPTRTRIGDSSENGASLETLREELLEIAGMYLIRFGQVHHDSEKVQAELERIHDALWKIYETDAQRPEPENSDPSDID